MKKQLNIFWFRRDLRLSDNTGLYHALRDELPVLPIFIFDRLILDELESKEDARVEFIYGAIQKLQDQLLLLQSSLEVYDGLPVNIFKMLLEKYQIGKVFTNEDYEPYAIERDNAICTLLRKENIPFESFKDQVIFSKNEVVKSDHTPYTIFTPYSNAWKRKLKETAGASFNVFPTQKYVDNLFRQKPCPIPGPDKLGFKFRGIKFPSVEINSAMVRAYASKRDYPGLDATTHMGVHLRFGTVSIRALAVEAAKDSDVYLNELIWRDFYQMILWHFPKVGKGHAFKEAYENIKWRNNEPEFAAWCAGKTGYPMVDAAMHQLNETGFMHNRMRMLTASFLAKHLLIDWRWGEAYFAEKLLDYDLASNNGGWQWAAGCGCDAAPYFRIFNPYIQQKKFDPQGIYIKRWLPEYQDMQYPAPMVEHAFARDRAISVYKEALNGHEYS